MERDWINSARHLARQFADRTHTFDEQQRFVEENYRQLAGEGFFGMAVPSELGGGGATYDTACWVVYELGKGCPATALAFSMHTHLVAANVWKYHAGKRDAATVLQRVAAGNLALVSTGATDWLDSNGVARRVEGGYRVTARKRFASGAPGAHILVTSAVVAEEGAVPTVVHFSLPLSAQGVKVLDDWHVMGMRGSGSNTVIIEDAFVPDAAVSFERPAGKWHPAWDVVLGVAPALYMAPYVGAADRIVEHVCERERQKTTVAPSQIGELLNAQTTARVCWEDMIRLNGNYRFRPSLEVSSALLSRKTLVSRAVRETLDRAVAIAGGSAFFQASLVEQLWRDVQACQFHALPEHRQLEFSGRQALGLDPAVS